MNHRPIPDEPRADLCTRAAELYQANGTIRTVAEKLGQSEYATRKLLVEAGVTIRQGGPLQASDAQRGWNNFGRDHSPGWRKPKITPAQRVEIKQRLADGEKPTDLATEYGVTAGLIRQLR
ncbi:helix-turn-helix domain-containing protein [Streptomyces sp. NPDC008240]|uniref:helix-turn-helix domain-containing protein n=1 Tax=Streptomyces sp. NPDC008240 TaxID=3364822 RepID=UPI0036E981C2